MIEEFQGEHRFLSNFWGFDKPMRYGPCLFKTNEHFYVAMKVHGWSVRKTISEIPTAGQVKRVGRNIIIREDFDEIKLGVMLHGLRYKFSEHNPNLRQRLIDTGEQEIQEGNHWGDTFWGIDLSTWEGKNNLGKLLMQVREEIQNGR